MYAAESEHGDCIDSLIDCGARGSDTDGKGRDALAHLLEGYGILWTGSRLRRMITRLVNAGANVNAVGHQRVSSLMHVLETGDWKYDFVTLLLGQGADILAIDRRGYTAIDHISADQHDLWDLVLQLRPEAKNYKRRHLASTRRPWFPRLSDDESDTESDDEYIDELMTSSMMSPTTDPIKVPLRNLMENPIKNLMRNERDPPGISM